MYTKRLGNSDLFITPIGVGAWAIGESGWEFALASGKSLKSRSSPPG
jgi:hypothetical protein